jgi:hypothetical protein
MIEKIRLDDNVETYAVEVYSTDVAVILCVQGAIEIVDFYNSDLKYATLNQYETWTLSNRLVKVKAVETTGAEFLVIRYFRTSSPSYGY